MAKHIVRENGKYIDRNNGNAEFNGRVLRDFQEGDVLERLLPNGKRHMTRIKKRQVYENGFVAMATQSWEEDA